MRNLCGEDDLPGCIIEQCQASHLAPRIELEPQWLKVRGLHCLLENKGKRVVFEHGCFARREQQARIARMDGIHWVFIGIQDEYF